MYKNRITKWKLDKRNKEREVMAVVRKKTERDAVGKASEFHIRGRVVSIDDVHRYLKRKGISIEDATALRAATPPDLCCCTPNGFPQSPANPEVFDTPRRIFVSIRSYVLGSVESKTWLPNNGGFYHANMNGDDSLALITFRECAIAACDLFNEGNFQKAGMFLVKGSALVRDILWQENPNLLSVLLNVLVYLRRSGWIDCTNILLNQFLNMAATILPDMHPLRRIFQCLISLDPVLAEEVLASSWESFLDMYEQELRAFSASSLQTRTYYICNIEQFRHPGVAEEQLRAIVRKSKEICGRLDHRHVEAWLSLVDFLLFQGRYAEAATTTKNAIRCANEGKLHNTGDTWCHGMERLADCQYRNFDDELAESTLRQVIGVYSTSWGWQDAYTLRLLTKLERWLTEFGKHEEAAEVSEQVAEILRQSNDFV
jgi:hypothetical protein